MSPPPRCVICHDDLSDANGPYATSCGHLCCEDCSTFHFSFDRETPCPFCRKPIKRDQLFRLYFDFNVEDEREAGATTASGSRRDLVAAARSVNEASKRAIDTSGGLDADFIRANVEAAEDLVQTLDDCVPRLKPILTSLGGVLADMRTRLQQLSEERGAEAYKDKLVRLESKYQHKLKKARVESDQAKQILQETLDASHRTQTDLQTKLNAVRRDLEQSERQLDDHEETVRRHQTEMVALKASNLKYRKKYHAMKQTMRETKRQSRAEDAEESLIIIG